MANAASKPSSCAKTAPNGAPTTVARTQPFESTALTRSQSGFGTSSGNRLRRPLLLKGPVMEATAAIRTSSQAGSARIAVLGSMTVDDAVAAARFPYHRWWEWQASQADQDAVDAALDATELVATVPARGAEL